ncbi:MAG: hypothetical protein KKF54_03905 [Candidatus Omnitrophica bacterium]|nr:hypothetical protein [Candidatus Omnitrophota bacterium]
MGTNSILIILLPILSGIIGSYITYYLTSKSKKIEAILRFKEEKYTNLLVLLQGFVGVTAQGYLKKSFFEEQYKSWLYCSDEVIEAINKMVRLVISKKGKTPNREEGKKAIGDIVVAMRKDLLGKTKLNYHDFQYTDVIE